MKRTYGLPLLAVLILAGFWFFWGNDRHNQPTDPFSGRLLDESKSTEEMSRRQSIVGQTNLEDPRSSVVWNKLENDLARYLENFTPSLRIGSGRHVWLNSPELRFWMERLKSEDPAVVAIAARVFEGANHTAYMAGANAGKKHQHQFTREEWQSRLVFDVLFSARCHVASSRLTANAVNPDGIIPVLSPEEIRYVKSGDNNDLLILKDAQDMMEFFVPRLCSSDSGTVVAAKSVLNLFTFDLFMEESVEWWEETLRHTRNSPPTNESEVFRNSLLKR
jgi:hypothetical protein